MALPNLFLGLLQYGSTKFFNDAFRPCWIWQLQAVIYAKSKYYNKRLPVQPIYSIGTNLYYIIRQPVLVYYSIG